VTDPALENTAPQVKNFLYRVTLFSQNDFNIQGRIYQLALLEWAMAVA